MLEQEGQMESFEKRAATYPRYNRLQRAVVKLGVRYLEDRVLDLGAGHGEVCRWKRFKFYLGIELSPSLARQNPCPVVVADFDQLPLSSLLRSFPISQIISFSALQWSRNLPTLFSQIAQTGLPYLLAIFTSDTFSPLHRYLGVSSPLPSRPQLEKWNRLFLGGKVKVVKFLLQFRSGRGVLNYLRLSGVASGPSAPLSKLVQFAKDSPFLTLPAEVLFLSNRPLPLPPSLTLQMESESGLIPTSPCPT
jgi:malonyl-CoA O-methyltransferase